MYGERERERGEGEDGSRGDNQLVWSVGESWFRGFPPREEAELSSLSLPIFGLAFGAAAGGGSKEREGRMMAPPLHALVAKKGCGRKASLSLFQVLPNSLAR